MTEKHPFVAVCLRWSITSRLLEPAEDGASETLPLNVVNNYFSFGADAHAALSFHLARERDPKRFNTRLGTLYVCHYCVRLLVNRHNFHIAFV